jgi:hypothetical protein
MPHEPTMELPLWSSWELGPYPPYTIPLHVRQEIVRGLKAAGAVAPFSVFHYYDRRRGVNVFTTTDRPVPYLFPLRSPKRCCGISSSCSP